MDRKYCYFYLTCETGEESRIARPLLEKHLVACAKYLPVSSEYWWHGKIEHAAETMIIFESATDLFNDVEAEVRKNHSYDTFVLTQVPMTALNSDAAKWLEENLKGRND
jgi:periplasmic divalent cation tolerance protein